MCLWLFTLGIPFVASVFIRPLYLCMPTSFLVVGAFAALHEIASYIEEPFRCVSFFSMQQKLCVHMHELLSPTLEILAFAGPYYGVGLFSAWILQSNWEQTEANGVNDQENYVACRT